MKIYIAGPIQGYESKQGYRSRLKRILSELGHEVFDPWEVEGKRNIFNNVDFLVAQNLMKTRLSEIDSCDALIAYFPKKSIGTAMEAMHAKSKGKLVVIICTMKNTSPWIVGLSKYFYKSISEFQINIKEIFGP